MSRAARTLVAAFLVSAIAAPAAAQSSVDVPTTRAEISAQLDARFGRLDSDKDGAVTKAELTQAQRGAEQRVSTQLAQNLAKEFTARDGNKDGALTSAELAAGNTATNTAELFKKVDADKDGKVSRAEYLAPSRSVKATADPDAIIKNFDRNGDSKIALAEYKAAPLASFDAADANKDGTVSPDEKKRVMAQRGR